MKKFVAIPLVAVMLAALAVPALAEGKDTLTETAILSQAIPVMGVYEKEEGDTARIVYSVDIEWGSMEFVYLNSNVPRWDPATHSESQTSSTGWTIRKEKSDNGLAANEIRLTNHSNTNVSALFSFSAETFFVAEFDGSGRFSDNNVSLDSAVDTSVQ